MDDQLRDLITDVVRSGSVYLEDRTASRTTVFIDLLNKLTQICTELYPTVFLKPSTYPVTPLLKLCYEILEHINVDNYVFQRVLQLLFRIVKVNLSLRRFCANSIMFPHGVYKVLKYNLRARQNVELVIDAFKVLQLLTYRTEFAVEGYGMDFLAILCDEIIDPQSPEMLSHSLSMLCNLVTRSKELAHAFMLEFYQSLSRKFLSYLSSDNYLVVISTLLILKRLNTPMSEKFFTSSNMFQTLLCAFNVLAQADTTLTVGFASDFLRLVLVTTNRDNEMEVTDLSRDFSTFSYFSNAIENTALRITKFDPRTEESLKILSLLGDLVNIKSLRSPVSQIIINATNGSGESCSKNFSSPLKCLVRMVALGVDKQPNSEVTINAIKLLNVLIKEIVDDGAELSKYENPAVLVAVVEMNAQTCTKEDTYVTYCHHLIAQTLILAQTLTQDNESCDMLTDAMSPELCAKINETQFKQNLEVFQACSSLNGNIDSIYSKTSGLMIPIEMIKLLALLKDHSRIHKDIYWRTLEDERILPFIAYSLINGTVDQIQSTLTVVPQCAQKLSFPWDILARNIANCSNNTSKSEANSSKSSIENDEEKQMLLQTVIDLRKELDTCKMELSGSKHKAKEKEDLLDMMTKRNVELEQKLDKALKELDQVKAVQNQVASLISDTTNDFGGFTIKNRLFEKRNGKK